MLTDELQGSRAATFRSAPAQKTLGTALLMSRHLVARSRRTIVTASTSSLSSCLPARHAASQSCMHAVDCILHLESLSRSMRGFSREHRFSQGVMECTQAPMAFLASGLVRLI